MKVCTMMCVVLSTWAGFEARAEVIPHRLISEGAVLQEWMNVPIWGTAKDGEQVSVEFQNQKLTTIAKEGGWRVGRKTLRPGGPFTLRIQGENTITLTNILVGEVWVCTGQSNMNFGLGYSEGGSEAVANSADPMLRLLSLPIRGAATPQRDFDGSLTWHQAKPDTTPNFSAVAYHFGRHLREDRKAPVGLIFGGNGSMSVQPLTPGQIG